MRKMIKSKVEWIGEIPDKWKTKRFKSVIVTSVSGEVIDKSYWNDGEELLYTCQKTPMKSFFDNFPVRKRTKGNCLLLTRNATPYIFIPEDNSIYSNVVQKVEIDSNYDRRYIKYSIQLGANEEVVNGDTIPSYNMDVWNNIHFCDIPYEEQRMIADFLDEKCNEIDNLSNDIQKEIDKLEEYRDSVITEVVTKGLNPDSEMKDSGFEWIGNVPTNWNLKKGRFLFEQKNEKGNKIKLVLLSPTQNYGVIPQEKYEELSGFTAVKLKDNTDLNQLKTVHKGAFIISLRSFEGGFEHSNYEGVVSPAYQVFYPTTKMIDRYYKYLFKTQIFIDKMNSFTMSLRDGKNISFFDFGNTYLPVPPTTEQERIADFLDTFVKDIEELSDLKNEQLAKLEKYKKSLIYEYVTGKKGVVFNG